MGDPSHRHGKKLSSRSGARELLFTKSRPGQSRRNSNRRELSHLIQPSHCPLPENSWSAVACHRFSAVNSATQTIALRYRASSPASHALHARRCLPARTRAMISYCLKQSGGPSFAVIRIQVREMRKQIRENRRLFGQGNPEVPEMRRQSRTPGVCGGYPVQRFRLVRNGLQRQEFR
jgi:hypothetical protein